LEKLGLNLGFLLGQIIAFGIVFITLRAWVYVPLVALLEKRRQAIAQGVEDARIAAEARANAEKEAERIVADAQTKAAQVMREASERAEGVALEIKAAAEKEAVKAREQAMAELQEERTRMLGELRNQVIVLAMAAAQKLVSETLDEKRQRALLEEFFSGVRGGRVVVLEGQAFTGQTAEVTSALPLTEAEQAAVRKDLNLGGAAEVSFRVDPSILGGVVVRVGDRVVDGSVAGKLQALRQTLH
jgi:F-type H+-transporting ATPase subunit b